MQHCKILWNIVQHGLHVCPECSPCWSSPPWPRPPPRTGWGTSPPGTGSSPPPAEWTGSRPSSSPSSGSSVEHQTGTRTACSRIGIFGCRISPGGADCPCPRNIECFRFHKFRKVWSCRVSGPRLKFSDQWLWRAAPRCWRRSAPGPRCPRSPWAGSCWGWCLPSGFWIAIWFQTTSLTRQTELENIRRPRWEIR